MFSEVFIFIFMESKILQFCFVWQMETENVVIVTTEPNANFELYKVFSSSMNLIMPLNCLFGWYTSEELGTSQA